MPWIRRGMVVLYAAVTTIAYATPYHVGPSLPYDNIGDVPWESIAAGDSVLIHWREVPYREKWVICRQGTAELPIVVKGVANAEGELPVVHGQDATTRLELDYWNEDRGVVKIGGASVPPDCTPSHIILENLEIRSGRQPFWFWNDSGSYVEYASSAASIYIEKGSNITIRGCTLDDSGDGLFTSWATEDVLVEGNYLYDNGLAGSIYRHNSYCEAQGIIYQYNHYGALRDSCLGNNLKDRSSGCVIRYNWIESGSRQLDLVDSDYSALYDDPSYRETFVYGNVLIEPDGAGNSQICHYGGDSGTTSHYRKGTLYFYNNTIVSTREGNTTLFRLSTNDESCDCRNNVAYVTAEGYHLALLDDTGVLDLLHTWLNEGWVYCHGGMSGTVNELGGILTGTNPGFWNKETQEFWLQETSDCIDAGTTESSACLPDHPIELEYVKHQQRKARALNGVLDIGAYEYPHGGGVPDQVEGLIAVPYSDDDLQLTWRSVLTDTCGLPVVVDYYNIYSCYSAYFAPDEQLFFGQVAGDTTIVVPDVLENPAENTFFLVAAERATVEGAASNPAGEFDFDVSEMEDMFTTEPQRHGGVSTEKRPTSNIQRKRGQSGTTEIRSGRQAS